MLRRLPRLLMSAPRHFHASRRFLSEMPQQPNKIQKNLQDPSTTIRPKREPMKLATRETLAELSLTQRFRLLSKEYGRWALAVYLSMSTTTFSIIYLALYNGVNVEQYVHEAIKRITGRDHAATVATIEPGTNGDNEVVVIEEVNKKSMKATSAMTTAVVAFALNKLLSPIKLALTVVITPTLVRWLRRRPGR